MLSRKDREIKLNGHRIDLNTVEAALRSVAEVDDAVVDVHPNGRGLRAFVLGQMGNAALHAIAQEAAAGLADYMLPRFWYGTTSLDLNNNSKLDRKRLVANPESDRPVIVMPPSVAEAPAKEDQAGKVSAVAAE